MKIMFVIWLIAYGLAYTISEKISFYLQTPHMITVFAMLLYWGVFLMFFSRKETLKHYRICFPQQKKLSKYVLYLPLLCFPIINLILFRPTLLIWDTLLIFCLVFGEEVLFRGVLFTEIYNRYNKSILCSAVIMSLLFALLHMVNLFTGATLGYVLVQGLCAVAMGFCFAMTTYRERSILFGVIIHFLINITSFGISPPSTAGKVAEKLDLTNSQTAIFVLAAVLYFLYGILLYKKEKK